MAGFHTELDTRLRRHSQLFADDLRAGRTTAYWQRWTYHVERAVARFTGLSPEATRASSNDHCDSNTIHP